MMVNRASHTAMILIAVFFASIIASIVLSVLSQLNTSSCFDSRSRNASFEVQGMYVFLRHVLGSKPISQWGKNGNANQSVDNPLGLQGMQEPPVHDRREIERREQKILGDEVVKRSESRKRVLTLDIETSWIPGGPAGGVGRLEMEAMTTTNDLWLSEYFIFCVRSAGTLCVMHATEL